MIVGGVGGRGGVRVGGRGLVGRGDREMGRVRGNDDDEFKWIGLDYSGKWFLAYNCDGMGWNGMHIWVMHGCMMHGGI